LLYSSYKRGANVAQEAPIAKRGLYKRRATKGIKLSKPFVILGAAKQAGETHRAVDIAFPSGLIDLVVLSEHHISGYDYAHSNEDDGFLTIVDRMLTTKSIVFATPVYWYAMSAPMKIFFDRLTDLLETSKEKGRRMAGKDVWVIASGTDLTLPDGFEVPFARTAQYFDIRNRGAGYLYTGGNLETRQASETAIAAFGQQILRGP
jgi:NADPH-dependent FMN reductase